MPSSEAAVVSLLGLFDVSSALNVSAIPETVYELSTFTVTRSFVAAVYVGRRV